MNLTFGQKSGVIRSINQLQKMTDAQSRSLERLSSGIRVSSAQDDAVAIGLADSLRSRKSVFVQALQNVNNGISQVNVAGEASEQLDNIVTRIKSLAEAASNSTISDAHRAALNTEAQALSESYNEIIASTKINQTNVFDSSTASFSVQAGYRGADIGIDLSIQRSEYANVEVGGSGLSAGDKVIPYGLSYSGDYAIFMSDADDLDSSRVEADGSQYDIFVQNMTTGSVEKVSVGTVNVAGSNTESSSYFSSGQVSDDGRYAVFYGTGAATLGSSAGAHLFMRDLETDTTSLVSVSSSEVENNGALGVGAFSMSGDGRYVVFESESTNLSSADVDATRDIFLRDTVAGTTTLISVSSSGTKGNGTSSSPQISTDGRYITYVSAATNLVSGDTNGLSDIFLFDRVTGTTTRVNKTDSGSEFTNGNSSAADISADGRYISYQSTTTDRGVSGGYSQIYRYDKQSGQTVLVSQSDAGSSGNNDSLYASISADGNQIAYRSTASNLVSGDTNGYQDIFVTDVSTGVTRRVSVSDSGAQANGNSGASTTSTPAAAYNSFANVISGNGKKILFDTGATNLTSGTTLGNYASIINGNPIFEEYTVTPMSGVVLSSQTTSENTAYNMSSYQDELTVFKGKVSASSSRLEQALQNIDAMVSDLDQARERIIGVDIAEELANQVSLSLKKRVAVQTIKSEFQVSKTTLSLLSESQSLPG